MVALQLFAMTVVVVAFVLALAIGGLKVLQKAAEQSKD
jgi:hypothetical protein